MNTNRYPTAYFTMNRRDSVGPRQVHEMLKELQRRMGVRRMGGLAFSVADDRGGYVIAFEKRETADAFETRYRNAGGSPRRSSRLPKGMVLVSSDVVAELHILENASAFLRHICGHASHGDPRARKAHLN